MKIKIIDKLFEALTTLEGAITGTREVLASNSSISEDSYKSRLDTYEAMLNKQRTLTEELDVFMKTAHPSSQTSLEIRRRVDLINGLSSMLRDDAKELTLELVYKRKIKDEDCL